MTSSRATTTTVTLFTAPRLQTLAAREVLDLAAGGNLPAYDDCKDLETLMEKNAAIEDALTPEIAHRVVQHIVYGKEAQAKEILDKHPSLRSYILSYEDTVEDYSGRKLTGTALQIAFGAQDVEMCEMLLPYFDQLTGGREEALRQIREMFPNESDSRPAYKVDSLAQAIINSSPQEVEDELNLVPQRNSQLTQELNQFRQEFTKVSMEEGIHFNPRHLLEAFEVYEKEFDHFKDWNRRDLFWRQVIGYVQRYLPSCYAQAFSQGIYYIVENREALQRSFKFRMGDGQFFPLTFDSHTGLGYTCAVWGMGGPGARGCWRAGARGCWVLPSYVRAKTAILSEFTRQLQQRTQNVSRCTLL